jgi:F-type H+-transporting ATPase subunit epsilon
MNANQFTFDLVSPDKVLVSEPVWQVTIPGEEGYFGVRSGHASLIAAVKAGVVEITRIEGSASEAIFVIGGFADVTATNCVLLVEQAANLSDINEAAITAELENLAHQKEKSVDDVEKATLTNKIAIANLKLTAVQNRAKVV